MPRLPAAGAHADLWAVAALERWLAVAAADGAFLRRRAVAAGVSGDFAGHLPRRGFITNAAKKKIPIA